MAAALTVQTFAEAGGTITWTTTGAGGLAQTANTTPCGPGLVLLIKNDSASPIDVRMKVPAAVTYHGLGIANATPGSGFRPLTVAAGAEGILPLPAAPYVDPATGLATFEFSATPTSVSVACVSAN